MRDLSQRQPLRVVDGGRRQFQPPPRPTFMERRSAHAPMARKSLDLNRRFYLWRTAHNGIRTLLFTYHERQAAEDVAKYIGARLTFNRYEVEDTEVVQNVAAETAQEVGKA